MKQRYRSYEAIEHIPDKLRWCRHRLGLNQAEVAELIGVSKLVYINYETGNVKEYPVEQMDKLSKLYGIPLTDLLDGYSCFLQHGQGKAIREHRESLGVGKNAYARLMKIDRRQLAKWESEKVKISRNTWEKYFEGVIEI